VLVVARATFLEAGRDRGLLVSVAFAVALALFSRVLGWLSLEDTLKMVQDFSLTGLLVLAILLAMLVGAQSLAREVERRTIYTVLSRDCTRGEFLLGKYAGLVAVTWTAVLAAAAFAVAWIALNGGAPTAAVGAAVLGILAETLVLIAMALLLGSLASPTIASVGVLIFTLCFHATGALLELTSGDRNKDMKPVFDVVQAVVPNLQNVNFINGTTSGRPVEWGTLGLGTVQMILWSAAFLLVAGSLFRRRQF
jgi:ABC-type transport system involved in multi-copper enzyme maturation permease subunit